MDKILAQLGESSTWTSIAAVAAGFGVVVPPGILQDCILAGGLLSAVAGIVIKEGWKQALTTGDAVKAIEQRIAAIESQKGSK